MVRSQLISKNGCRRRRLKTELTLYTELSDGSEQTLILYDGLEELDGGGGGGGEDLN